MADRFQGMDFHNWANRFGSGDMIDQLMRNLGTVQSQGFNQASDMANMNNLPLSVQMAMNRGVQYQAGQSLEKGQLDAAQMDREGQMAAANLMMQNRINQPQSFGESMMGLLGQLGGAVGMGAGYGLFAPKPKPA